MVTMPVTFVAFPVKFPTNIPLASRLTMLFAKFEFVALLAKLTPAAISSFVFPPTVITVGLAAVPPKSPANKILPLVVVVASATELVMEPDASAKALAMYSVVASFVLLSLSACVTPVAPIGKTGRPVKVGEFRFAFKSSEVCCAILTGLLASLVLSINPIPKFVLAFVLVDPPVPPFATATIPDTFVAFPVTVPVKLPVILPVTFPVTLPIKLDEIVPALKFPLASLLTKALAKLVEVPFPNAITAAAILSFVFPPTLITIGTAPVPPKSPANNIFPLLVVVASATELVMVPEASAKALATYSVVATRVELSFKTCVIPIVVLGNVTLPVKVGETKFAFKLSAVNCDALIGLFASLVLSTSDKPKFDLALEAKFAPVPPFAIATTPETLDAFPVTFPNKFPVTFPNIFPVTFPIKFPLNVFAVMVLPEKSPIGLLRTK